MNKDTSEIRKYHTNTNPLPYKSLDPNYVEWTIPEDSCSVNVKMEVRKEF